MAAGSPYMFSQMHIDVARNTTDDFNPFHDPKRWQLIRDNPYSSAIVLGFQTEFLISDLLERLHRGQEGFALDDEVAPFSNYEFRFVDALLPGEPFDIKLRKTVNKTASGGGLSTRAVMYKADGTPVLLGSQSETVQPRFLADTTFPGFPELRSVADRTRVPGTRYFLKRKFLTTSNGKNFVLAGLGTQQNYFDELADFVSFPPLFTAALSSCALLEQAWQQGYDFQSAPLVYTSHQISVDRRLQRTLRSNDVLHLLVDGPLVEAADAGGPRTYHVFGVIRDNGILFRAKMQLSSLQAPSRLSVAVNGNNTAEPADIVANV